MEQAARLLLCYVLFSKVQSAFLYTNVPANSLNLDSVVVAYHNLSVPAGSEAVLQCHSRRMVWTHDRLNDRQRVAHWDWYSIGGEYKVKRVLDMFSAGDQRVYNTYDEGRIMMSATAFSNGNFSLVIRDFRPNDKGIYTCNLHHHYCHLYETVRIQLNITKSVRKVRKFWDGVKVVVVGLAGSTVVLPCENRNHIWTERHSEEEQQVVHWDRSPPGVWHDQADRLIDLYASGEQRSYGPLFIRKRMNISETAFADGDFSLIISNLRPGDEGLYSCDLHHHYCGIHERRIFNLFITEPVKVNFTIKTMSTVVEVPKVINVFIPEQPSHFLHQLGYVLATILLLAILITIIALVTRRRKKRGLQYNVKKSQPIEVNLNDFVLDTTDIKPNKNDDIKLGTCDIDYKNNILKEKIALSKEKVELIRELPPKNIDKDFEKKYWK
ncbi:matrix remodeling-associated protein 8 isoform X2 [Callorhinchus milii]|uniref:matrix remodeling-associated protein 8 isoform X2 n=1 Tax=Callorhinchus milii TaxID=7868 RepID=UPI00045721C5|nr:matrix remodeling-associated protein 8 isoform X2 [Callorhinchus milii]|eukprot:gi/632960193/ref/XP_007896054.1/ PREDICTED: matrix-remodeling-associated protein 8 isoform X2 [Callorhinchus milii]